MNIRGLAAAIGLGVTATLAMGTGLPGLWLGAVGVPASFPLAGAAVGPRGSRRRGAVAGLFAYVIVGLVVTVILYVREGVQPFYFGPLFFIQALIWPVMVSIGGPGLG